KDYYLLSGVVGGLGIAMNRTRITFLSIFLVLIFLQAASVNAHPPGPMTLDYDFDTQILSIDITHVVDDVNTHHIAQVRIEKNSVEVLTRTYSTQNTTSGFSATFALPAAHGDVFSVRADCSISGNVIGDVNVQDPSITTPIGTPMDMTMIVAVAIVAIGVIAVVFAFMKRR
ncbi:MAG: hypothetical protein ACFFEE_10715, partial [Candidatus Thorarchaeota archaeon]